MVRKDVESATTHYDARLLVGDATDSVCLSLKQCVAGVLLLLSVVCGICHIVAVEVGEVVAPQRVTHLDLLYGILHDSHPRGHLVQYLLVQQLHSEPACQLLSNLVSTSTKLTADGNNKFVLLVHTLYSFNATKIRNNERNAKEKRVFLFIYSHNTLHTRSWKVLPVVLCITP